MTAGAEGIDTVEDLLGARQIIEESSAEQYEELADSFEMSNNLETAEVFKWLAEWEGEHLMSAANGAPPPGFQWFVYDPGDPEAVHYLMRPYHAWEIALTNEERSLAFFQAVAERTSGDVRDLAWQLAEREQEHVRLIRDRLAATPEPEPGWDDDLDPPNYDM